MACVRECGLSLARPPAAPPYAHQYRIVITVRVAMEDFDEIKSALSDPYNDGDTDRGTNEERVMVASTDPIETLSARMSMIVSENADLKARVKRLENLVSGLVSDRSGSRQKSRISIPSRELFGSKPPADVVSVSSTPSSIVDMPGSRAESVSAASNPNMHEFINPFEAPNRSGNMRLVMSKSNSATAAMGYDRKASVWGTALASMLIAATRFYITKTNAHGILIDELRLMRNCTNIAPVIYSSAMHKELPGVKDGVTKYLSESISRVDKNEVPLSTAQDWHNLEMNQYGRDAMTVLNSLIAIAKEVPEAVMHPVSQVISILIPPVVRDVNGEVKFAMYAEQPVNPIPNQWEKWCLVLKDTALTKYLKYRLSGMTEGTVMSKMTNEMRESDLVEKKNMFKLNEIKGPLSPEF